MQVCMYVYSISLCVFHITMYGCCPPDVWFLTSGYNYGVMKCVGESVSLLSSCSDATAAAIGVTPWNSVKEKLVISDYPVSRCLPIR